MATYNQNRYKTINATRNVMNNHAYRAKVQEIKRKEQRAEDFAKKRDLEVMTDVTTNTDNKDNRFYKLLRWKAEKDILKKMEQMKKKPPFKVGVVHHNYYSPPVKSSIKLPATKQDLHNYKQMKHPVTPPRRITRATQKRLLANSGIPKEIKPIQNSSMNKQELLVKKENKKKVMKDQKKSFAPSNYKFTAPVGLTSMPIFGRVPMLHTPAKSLNSEEKTNKAELFLSKTCMVKINKEDKTSGTDVINESIEAVALELSCDEYEMTLDGFVKEEFLRNSTFSNSNHSPIISSPGNISAINTENKPMTADQSNIEGEMFSSQNIAEVETENQSSKNTNNNQTNLTTPLINDLIVLNDINSPKEPVFFSPYIVSSRGKSNARKEQQIRRGIGCSPAENIPTKETVMTTLNISIEEEERTAQYFSFMLNKETDRLNELCKKWTEVQSESDSTEDAQYRINQAIGQTRLLINKKFERFRKLVFDCETGKGEMLVTCRDLEGFWDMMYMEVMNCDSRFEALEKLRSNDWKEEEIAVTKIIPKKTVGAKKKMVFKKKSSVQDFILTAKKKMKNNTGNFEILENHMNENINKLSTSINNIDIEQKTNKVLRKNDTRQSVLLNSKDIQSISSQKSSSRQSLLQKTLLSESCKTVKTPMTIMKISQMCKIPKVELDDSISYINSKQTPSKSILKRTDDSTINETRCMKSIQKVNFDDRVTLQEVPVDEETQNKLDLTTRLARIDNYDFDAEYINYNIRAEKKLNFDDTSFTDSESNLQHNTEHLYLLDKTNNKNDTFLNLETQLIGNTSPGSGDISSKILADKSTANETNTKILRNRVVVTDNSTRLSTRRKSIKDLVNEHNDYQKENKTPVKLKSRPQKMSNKFEEKKPITKEKPLNAAPVNVRKDLRRSSRKTVRLNAEECSDCTEHELLHPMTPNTRYSAGHLNLSFLKKDNEDIQPPLSNGDLILWDSPRTPARVRRSSRSSNKHFL